jgi:hypothetical protein
MKKYESCKHINVEVYIMKLRDGKKRAFKLSDVKRGIMRKIFMGVGLSAIAITFEACYGMPIEDPLVAMYGMPPGGRDTLMSGYVKAQKTGAPIPGIKVSLKDASRYDYTNSEGYFTIFVSYDELTDQTRLFFSDVDGESNGGVFKPKDLPWSEASQGVSLENQ